MSNNLVIKDGLGISRILGSHDLSTVHFPKHMLVDQYGRDLHIDKASGTLPVITTEHQEIHEGDHYFVKTWFEDTGGTDNVTYFAFTTPISPSRLHAKLFAQATVDFIIEIWEDGSVTGGTTMTPVNNNRESVNVSGVTSVMSPSITTPGNLIWAARTGGIKSVAISLNNNYEIFAKFNSTYIIKFTKKVAGDGIIDVDFFWYEHTDTF